MSGYHVITEAEHDSDDTLAKRCMSYLTDAYPGHPWHLLIKGGVMAIKHMNISANYGAILHYRKVVHDENTLKRGIVYAGGELLERAGLSRGRIIEGQAVEHVEGIPDNHLVTRH